MIHKEGGGRVLKMQVHIYALLCVDFFPTFHRNIVQYILAVHVCYVYCTILSCILTIVDILC